MDDYLMEIVDDEWCKDELPFDHIPVPSEQLPDPEADNGDPHLTLCEQEQKWTDLALTQLAPEMQLNEQMTNANGN